MSSPQTSQQQLPVVGAVLRPGGWRFAWVALAWLALVGVGRTPAQAPQFLPDTLFVVGTPTTDTQGRAWAYLLWVATDQQLALGRNFAVYAKAGDAGAPGNYERRAVTGLQFEAPVIQALLQRAAGLGDDLTTLEQRVDNLFAGLQPPAGALAPKISAVLRGSVEDPENLNNLVLLARLHPGLNFCLGYAHAEPLGPGKTTFEIREHDKATGQDLGVVGRVTVEAGNPVILPAPGPLVRVPERDARGDLNVKLRWATSANLRRLTLLNHGFNVYRVTRAYAEGQGFHTTPPAGATLRQLATGHPAVRRVHDLPVMKTRDYDPATVGDFVGDPTTIFLADDNGRYKEGGLPFENGSQYYYFVAARDVLGRDGLVSPGVMVTVCDRVAPDAPRGVQVANDYSFNAGVTRQALRVRWLQETNDVERVVSYHVYRWASPGDVQKFGGIPMAPQRIAGPIAHVPGQVHGSYLDIGPTSPSAPADYGRTYWYTVRSVDDGACDGGNFSANSAPAFGVLRDRTGPEAPTGTIRVTCCVPSLRGEEARDVAAQGRQDESLAYYRFVVRRSRPEIEWAEFHLRSPGPSSNSIARAYFEPGNDVLEVEWQTLRTEVDAGVIPFYAQVGSDAGETSEFALVNTIRAPKTTTVREVPFGARYNCQELSRREAVAAAAAGEKIRGCDGSHDPRPGGEGGEVVGPGIVITLTPGTKEYRLYRRVDNGPLTLIKQAPANFDDAAQVPVVDPDMPANAAILCYYGQLFDEHGNASPLALLDECIEVKLPTAVPLLAALEPVGDLSSPKMRIRWFCPPYGVDRFEVSIANNLGAVAANVSPDLSSATTNRVKQFSQAGSPMTNLFFLYRTPRVGPAFGNGAVFEAVVNVALGLTYDAMVAAVGVDGAVNQDSNAERFRWTAPVVVGPDAPWPARPLPDLNIFHAGLRAVRLPDFFYPGVGVRIGAFPRRFVFGQTEKPEEPTRLREHVNPLSLLYSNRHGQSLLPVAMYRVQWPTVEFPQVSQDIVQVSPLMEDIAHEFTIESGQAITRVHDPFIRVGAGVGTPSGANEEGAVYLLDTQPVIAGAAYLYLMVRFTERGEVLEVVPSNAVEVTP